MGIGNEINENEAFQARLVELYNKDPKPLHMLEEEFGAARQTVSKWLNGTRLPNAASLVKIARYYNVSVDYLLGLSNTKSPDVNARVAAEYTGLSERAVEWLHSGLGDFECDGVVGLDEATKKENCDTASALIQDKAFSKMIHHLKEISLESYLERILNILWEDYSECDLPEDDPNFHYASKEDREIVVANHIHVLTTKRPWQKEEIQEWVSGMDDNALSCDVVRAMFAAEQSNEVHQFHAAKAFSGYIDRLVEESVRKAERRFGGQVSSKR